MACSRRQNLNILYWNTRSIIKRREEIERILHKIDILVCVETWLNETHADFNFSGFFCYRKDRSHSVGGGILLAVRKNIAFKEITNISVPNTAIEMCGLRITGANPPFNLLACYRPPGETLSIEQWNQVINNININDKCILVGDFNAQNITWNCDKNDTNGNNLLDAIQNFNIFLHNSDSISHIDKTSKSNIDLIFSTPNIADQIDIKINAETCGSDHFPIFIYYNSEKSLYRKKTFHLHSKRTNWMLVHNQLNTMYSELLLRIMMSCRRMKNINFL